MKLEREVFESANDREEYYHLLAGKIFEMQKDKSLPQWMQYKSGKSVESKKLAEGGQTEGDKPKTTNSDGDSVSELNAKLNKQKKKPIANEPPVEAQIDKPIPSNIDLEMRALITRINKECGYNPQMDPQTDSESEEDEEEDDEEEDDDDETTNSDDDWRGEPHSFFCDEPSMTQRSRDEALYAERVKIHQDLNQARIKQQSQKVVPTPSVKRPINGYDYPDFSQPNPMAPPGFAFAPQPGFMTPPVFMTLPGFPDRMQPFGLPIQQSTSSGLTQPGVVQPPWYQYLTKERREDSVELLLKALSPEDFPVPHDYRFNDMTARKIENDILVSAKDRDEYDEMLAEKIDEAEMMMKYFKDTGKQEGFDKVKGMEMYGVGPMPFARAPWNQGFGGQQPQNFVPTPSANQKVNGFNMFGLPQPGYMPPPGFVYAPPGMGPFGLPFQQSTSSGSTQPGWLPPPTMVKDWQKQMPIESRGESVRKLINVLPPDDYSIPHDYLSNDMTARKVENDIFQSANNRDEYDDMVTKKVVETEELKKYIKKWEQDRYGKVEGVERYDVGSMPFARAPWGPVFGGQQPPIANRELTGYGFPAPPGFSNIEAPFSESQHNPAPSQNKPSTTASANPQKCTSWCITNANGALQFIPMTPGHETITLPLTRPIPEQPKKRRPRIMFPLSDEKMKELANYGIRQRRRGDKGVAGNQAKNQAAPSGNQQSNDITANHQVQPVVDQSLPSISKLPRNPVHPHNDQPSDFSILLHQAKQAFTLTSPSSHPHLLTSHIYDFSPSASQLSSPTKDWHSEMSQVARYVLIEHLVRAALPEPFSIVKYHYNNVIISAKKVEKEVYELANKKDHYFIVMCEKIGTLKKVAREAVDKDEMELIMRYLNN